MLGAYRAPPARARSASKTREPLSAQAPSRPSRRARSASPGDTPRTPNGLRRPRGSPAYTALSFATAQVGPLRIRPSSAPVASAHGVRFARPRPALGATAEGGGGRDAARPFRVVRPGSRWRARQHLACPGRPDRRGGRDCRDAARPFRVVRPGSRWRALTELGLQRPGRLPRRGSARSRRLFGLAELGDRDGHHHESHQRDDAERQPQRHHPASPGDVRREVSVQDA